MKRYKKGFSIAEALVTLTIVSLILAAVLPVISKRQNTSDSMWKYTELGAGSNSNIYYGLGSSQTAIIGHNQLPTGSSGSKLVIVTPVDSGGDTIKRSLIDFYQANGTAPTNIGRMSLDSHGNTAVGLSALAVTQYTGVGYEGLNNTAVGSEALKANTTGYYNTAVGQQALSSNTIGLYNVAIGRLSMAANISSDFNTAIGTSSLRQNKGGCNTAVGFQAAFSNTTANNNTAVGYDALEANLIASNNTAVGYMALNKVKTADNTAVGYKALTTSTDGINVAIGSSALEANTTGTGNTAIGYEALKMNTTGNDNTAVGDGACYSTTGSGNVCIGNNSDGGGTNNKLFIDNGTANSSNSLIYGDFAAATRSVKINGNLSVAASGSSAGTLTVASNGWINGSTPISSDVRLKNIIKENKVGLEKILKLKIWNYTKKDDKTHRVRTGVIAQEIQKIIPTSVMKNPDNGYLYVDSNEVLYTMVNAVKQLYQKIVALVNRVDKVEAEITALKRENLSLKSKLEIQDKVIKKLDSRLKKLETAR